MARVNPSDVEKIGDFDKLDNTELFRFIQTANRVVDDRLSGEGLSSEKLTDIELFLSAHFASMKHKRVAESDLGDSAKVYEGDTDQTGLQMTRYGQQAAALDPTGLLDNGNQVYFTTVNTDG